MFKRILMSALLAFSASVLAIDPSDMPMYEDNFTDYSVTIGDRINGTTHVSCTGGCSINGIIPGVVNVCDSGDVCEATRGPVTTEPSPVTPTTTPAPTTTTTPAP